MRTYPVLDLTINWQSQVLYDCNECEESPMTYRDINAIC